ncbi:DUF6702 family protein [Parasphingorhabdus cellanae]|uniref:POTRA domain-containing protein n=1 Tax=Parasphingorhabdus cellanae TaxID=2806553 RepID=A0ABX7T7L7_9SPHN|nr:DUF6702 family protein [Parasphingorhabdus cellanae]QTD56898.1 hypothetical protein J4G78_04815 [Parasphingorhabdus cellanae]
MRLPSLLMVLLMALSLAVPAAAHQQKITISTVSHNPRTEMLEVVHRITLHDAEHALKSLGVRAPDIVADMDNRRAFAKYVAERFTISVEDEPVDLMLLGSEIDAGSLFIYQEMPSPARGSELQISSQILTDISSRQENRVNLGVGTKVKTLIFRAGDGFQAAVLP